MGNGDSSLIGALRGLGLREPHASRLVLTDPWGAALPPTGEPGLYVVRSGTVWLRRRPQDRPRRLVAGDIALLPHGAAHTLAGDPTGPTPPLAELLAAHGGARGSDVDGAGGGGREARMDTFCFRVDGANGRRLLGCAPDLVVVPGHAERAWTAHVARALSALLDSPAGPREASAKIAEVLFGVALSELLTRRPAALGDGDASVTLALTLIHADLAHPWTVTSLARRVGRSRSAFHDRFKRWTGEAPMVYVARARLEHARELLAAGEMTMEQIAEAVGYASASAFAVAFRRHHGVTPSDARRSARRAEIAVARTERTTA